MTASERTVDEAYRKLTEAYLRQHEERILAAVQTSRNLIRAKETVK